jgi:hypothetical protein
MSKPKSYYAGVDDVGGVPRAHGVSPAGNLVTVAIGSPIKDGWRQATADDFAKVEAANKVRDAKEAAEATKAAAKAKADQDAKDKAEAKPGGPLA